MIADGSGQCPVPRIIVADDAGALLVRSSLVTSAALDRARARVADQGGTLGEQLVADGAIEDDALTSFYKQRLLVPQVNPNTLARLPAKVVAVIPSDMAIELRAIPVSLDSDNNLTVAMSDPSDRHAVDEIAFFTGSYVVRAVATQMQIAWCLAHYYGHVTELGERLLQPEAAAPPQAGSAAAEPDAATELERPRARGITSEIQAQRHKRIAPGEVFVDGATTSGGASSAIASGEIRARRAPSIKPPLIDESGPVVVIEDSGSGPIEPPPPPTSTSPASRAVSPRAASPPARDSNPVIEMEADEGSPYEPVISIGEGNDSRPVPKRRRPAEPDPPELAARAGEVQLATGQPIKKIELHEPRIIIADELAREMAPRTPPRDTEVMEPQLDAPASPADALPAEVSGEVRVREQRDRGPTEQELSSIFVELGGEDSAPVLIHDPKVDESTPVLLDRRRESDVPTNVEIAAAPVREIEDPPSEPIELPIKRPPTERKKTSTQVGVGAVSATGRMRVVASAATAAAVPSDIEDAPTGVRAVLDSDTTRIDARAVPPLAGDASDEVLAVPPAPYDGGDTSPFIAPPPPSHDTPPPSGQIKLDGVQPAQREPADGDDDDGHGDEVTRANPTGQMPPLGDAGHLDVDRDGDDGEDDTGVKHPAAPHPSAEDIDDGWGPPGTTIPPPLLGAIPGVIEPASGLIPLPDVDSAPLIVAPPVPPERGVRAQSANEAGLSRALEEATARVLELIHTLDHTTDRDQIIAVMIAHLAESHRRAGFFAMRGGALSLFAITPRIPEMPLAQLRLDRPSTLEDVVGTRLPYRGPMLDDTSRAFLTAILGACPPEILLVPIAVRERVVGVLFGEQRIKHTFDDQLALAARAAGMALERLLKTKRG